MTRHQRWLFRLFFCLLGSATIFVFIVIVAKVINSADVKREEHKAGEIRAAYSNAVYNIPDESSGLFEIQPIISEMMLENPDAVALLNFADNRSRYVCQTTNNDFYMTHKFDGSDDAAGMVFMDFRNVLEPRSQNIILYGHNQRDGSRFGILKRFESKEYLKEYPIFQLIDRYRTANYVPFAILHISVIPGDPDYFYFEQIDFDSDEDFYAYIFEAKSRSILKIPVEVDSSDNLLTLATCHSGIDGGCLVIILREVRSGEKYE